MTYHHFFDSANYPWHRPEARRLHDILVTVAPDGRTIERLYRQSANDLPALNLSLSPTDIWTEALRNLTQHNALSALLDIVAAEYATNHHVQKAIEAIHNADNPAVPVLPDAVFSCHQ